MENTDHDFEPAVGDDDDVGHDANHDVPKEEFPLLDFDHLDTDRSITSGSVRVLPLEQFDIASEVADDHDIDEEEVSDDKGYLFLMQFMDEDELHDVRVLNTDGKLYGWCPCKTFGEQFVCDHLYAAYLWRQGLVKADNEESARNALAYVDKFGVLPRDKLQSN